MTELAGGRRGRSHKEVPGPLCPPAPSSVAEQCPPSLLPCPRTLGPLGPWSELRCFTVPLPPAPASHGPSVSSAGIQTHSRCRPFQKQSKSIFKLNTSLQTPSHHTHSLTCTPHMRTTHTYTHVRHTLTSVTHMCTHHAEPHIVHAPTYDVHVHTLFKYTPLCAAHVCTPFKFTHVRTHMCVAHAHTHHSNIHMHPRVCITCYAHHSNTLTHRCTHAHAVSKI